MKYFKTAIATVIGYIVAELIWRRVSRKAENKKAE